MNSKELLAVSLCLNLAFGALGFTRKPAPVASAPAPVTVAPPQDAARAQPIRLRADPTLTNDRREGTMLAVQTETRTAILRVLGPTVGPAYLDHPATKAMFGEVGRPARP